MAPKMEASNALKYIKEMIHASWPMISAANMTTIKELKSFFSVKSKTS